MSDHLRTNQRIIVIVGPTAGGKSELAVGLAERFGGEVIGADSMQVYRGLDAGTAKPEAELRRRVAHHLIDVVEPTEPFTVADWLERAEGLIGELQGRGVVPIVVGGTNLYLKALLEGMFEGPGSDAAYRESLADRETAELWEEMRGVDSASADRIHRNDRKRIVRALEVQHLTGKPISEQQEQWKAGAGEGSDSGGEYRHNPILIGLRWETEAINRRINARVKLMFDPLDGSEGLIEETQRLESGGLLGEQARQALGTKQVLDHLAGKLTHTEAIEKVKIETRRFAKNQRTWLRRYRGVHWLESGESDGNGRLSSAIAFIEEADAA